MSTPPPTPPPPTPESIREEFDAAWWRGENPDPEEYARRLDDPAAVRQLAEQLFALRVANTRLLSDLPLRCRELLRGADPEAGPAPLARVLKVVADLLAEAAPADGPKRTALLGECLRVAVGFLFGRGQVVRPADFHDLAPGDDGRRTLCRAFEQFASPYCWRFRRLQEGRINGGGQAEIWRGRDDALDREVVLKYPLADDGPDLRETSARERRLEREARIMAGIDHPGVPSVFGVGRDGAGRLSLAMEYLPGRTLAAELTEFHRGRPDCTRRNPLFLRLVGHLRDACEAVGAAHRLKPAVLHLDLKPANIMVGADGVTAVIDWGLARHQGEAEAAAARNGTPEYMSPEQARELADQLEPPADVYSLGTTLYELLTGRCPADWLGEDELRLVADLAVLTANLRRTPAPAASSPGPPQAGGGYTPWLARLNSQIQGQKVPATLAREAVTWARFLTAVRGHFRPPREVARHPVDAELDAICRRAMARDPGDRYPAAADLAVAIGRWLRDEPPDPADRLGPVARRRTAVARWARRRPARVVGLFVGGVMAAAVAVALSWYAQERRARQQVEGLQEQSYVGLVGLSKILDDNPRQAPKAFRDKYLKQVAEVYSGLLDAEGPARTYHPRRAEVYRQLVRAYRGGGNLDRAAETLKEAVGEAERLAAAGGADATTFLAEVHHLHGEVQAERRKHREARDAYNQAAAAWTRLRNLLPPDRQPEADRGLARTWGYFGDLHLQWFRDHGDLGRLDDGRTCYEESDRHRERLWRDAGGSWDSKPWGGLDRAARDRRIAAQEQYAHGLNNLARIKWVECRKANEVKRGKERDARTALNEHLRVAELQRQIITEAAKAADTNDRREELAEHRAKLGRTLVGEIGRLQLLLNAKKDAHETYQEGYTLFCELLEEDGKAGRWQLDYASFKARAAVGLVLAGVASPGDCEKHRKCVASTIEDFKTAEFDKNTYFELAEERKRMEPGEPE